MAVTVDLYDSHYARLEDEVYRAIRVETFGTDLGQESWITAEECDRVCEALGIRRGDRVLEVACGSGGIATRIAETRGASVVGIDLNELAIEAAKQRSSSPRKAGDVQFSKADADRPLPFEDASFDFVLCNDAINHFRSRCAVLQEWRRVLRVGGKCWFTDPVVITGMVSNEELAARSSIGFFLFSVPGSDELELRAAGFQVEQVSDLTESVAKISRRWRDAREARRSKLLALEPDGKYDAIQRFLGAVHALAAERRLSRLAYVGKRIEA